MSLPRRLFRFASLVNTAFHVASGRPRRIIRHFVNKSLLKHVSAKVQLRGGRR